MTYKSDSKIVLENENQVTKMWEEIVKLCPDFSSTRLFPFHRLLDRQILHHLKRNEILIKNG